MKLFCPSCGARVSQKGINVSDDEVICQACCMRFSMSDFHEEATDPNYIPPGIIFHKTQRKTTLSVTTSFLQVRLFIFPVVSGMLGFFLWAVYIGIREGNMNGWFSVLFVLSFGSLLGCSWLLSLMLSIGKVKLILNNEGGEVFIGVWVIGITRTFTWDVIEDVVESRSTLRFKRDYRKSLKLVGSRNIDFHFPIDVHERTFFKQLLQNEINHFKSMKSLRKNDRL